MNKLKNLLLDVLAIIGGFVLVLLVEHFLVMPVHVDGTSMQPTLQQDQHLFVLRQADIKHDQIIVLQAKGVDRQQKVTAKTKYVKRVLGLPGDQIKYTKNGQLYRNQKLVKQDYISKTQQKTGTLHLSQYLQADPDVKIAQHKTFTVPKNHYFVLGDHRSVSNDSRYYGFVPAQKIDGVAKMLPWQKNHELVNR